MGSDIRVDLIKLNKCCSELVIIEKTLADKREEVENNRLNFTVSGKGAAAIKQQLGESSDNLKQLVKSVHEIKEGLEEIIRLYGFTESKIAKDASILKYIGDYISDVCSDLLDDCKEAFDDWLDAYKKRQENIISRIRDKETREGFSDEYQELLQQIYFDVPTEYEDARRLYDKYSRDLVVVDFDENSPFHSGGELHISTEKDLNNPRGNGTTFYHEYGHFIVYNEGWVDGSECKGDFKEFEDSLRREINAYCNGYEEYYRNEGISKGYSGARLDKYIENETKNAIKLDINGSENEYYHVNNGLSDIIDGVSNDKYQPSYGHPDGYWEENPSRVANEAFAQFFSAQMTGDTAEIEKMKELMPETYEIYTEMIKKAAS
jgi:DNA-binding ferritin-like protein (Dps family)